MDQCKSQQSLLFQDFHLFSLEYGSSHIIIAASVTLFCDFYTLYLYFCNAVQYNTKCGLKNIHRVKSFLLCLTALNVFSTSPVMYTICWLQMILMFILWDLRLEKHKPNRRVWPNLSKWLVKLFLLILF